VALELAPELGDVVVGLLIGGDCVGNALTGVEDGGVVAAAEGAADVLERGARELS
jgi:hypothetical protein